MTPFNFPPTIFTTIDHVAEEGPSTIGREQRGRKVKGPESLLAVCSIEHAASHMRPRFDRASLAERSTHNQPLQVRL